MCSRNCRPLYGDTVTLVYVTMGHFMLLVMQETLNLAKIAPWHLEARVKTVLVLTVSYCNRAPRSSSRVPYV